MKYDDFLHRSVPTVLSIVAIAICGCGQSSTNAAPARSEEGEQFDSYYEKIEHAGGRVVVELDFSGSDFSDDDLAKLEVVDRVRTLNLAGTKVTDAGLAVLKHASNLETIDLSDTAITEEGIMQLKEIPNLRSLHYHQGDISRKALLEVMKFLSTRQAGQRKHDDR